LTPGAVSGDHLEGQGDGQLGHEEELVIRHTLRGTVRGAALLGALSLLGPVAGFAAIIPSKASDAPTATAPRPTDLATVRAVVDREEVAEALAARGLAPAEVEERLARLSDEDLHSLAANVAQVQAAGDVPRYIWVLLAILIAVTIIATVF
jgi:uncharacterized protein DUF6627